MANLFKGFKQSTFKEYNETQDKIGYIWFVRTPKGDAVEGGDAEKNPDNNILNDSYDIYFGTKHYGHFMEGEVSAMATGLAQIKAAVGLDDSYDFIPSPEALKKALGGKNTVKDAIDYLYTQLELKLDKTTFEEYKASNDTAVASKAGYAELSKDSKTISFYKDNTEAKGEALFTIDASAFIKDGMLDDVTIVDIQSKEDPEYANLPTEYKDDKFVAGKYLKFSWKTQEHVSKALRTTVQDVIKTDYVRLTDIAPLYSADETSIHMDGTNKFSVKNVDTKKTTTSEIIPVEGGPLAESVKAVYPEGIPTGSTMQDILMKLLCQEKWAENPTSKEGDLTSTISKPVITFDPNPSNSLVEVGTQITVTVKNGASDRTITFPKASGFDYGYSLADDNTRDTKDTEKEAAATEDTITSNVSKLKVSGKISGEKDGKSAYGSAEVTGKFNATEGVNSVSADNTGVTYSVTFETLPALYRCSNLGKTNDEHHPAKASGEIVGTTKTSSGATSSNTKSVTGVYPIFCNGEQASGTASTDKSNPLAEPTVDRKLSLMTKGNEHFYVKFAKHALAGYTLYLPKGRTIASAVGINGLTGKYELKNNANAYVKQPEGKQFNIQGNMIDYDVYIYKADEGANAVEFKLNSVK